MPRRRTKARRIPSTLLTPEAAATRYMKRIGLEKIEAQSLALARQLRNGLAELGFEIFTPEGSQLPIVSFYVRETAEEVQWMLDAERVGVSLQSDAAAASSPVKLRIRAARAFFSNAVEVKRFLKVAEKFTAA